LARVIVGVESIVSRVYLVQVDEMSKQDVGPQVVWEYRATWVIDDLCFAGLVLHPITLT